MKNKTKASFLIIILSLIIPHVISAQTEWGKTGTTTLWQGLRQRQPESELPKGNTPIQTPQKIAKKNIPTKLIPVKQNEWIIADGWELTESTTVFESQQSIFDPTYDTKNWYNATVPGTVLTTLVNQGVYPEPTFGLNNMAIPDTLCRMDWWYRTIFDNPPLTKGERVRLLFNGINYRAEVFLNGQKLGNIEGAFMRGEFDITNRLRDTGKNILAVFIHPPYNPGIPHEQTMLAGQGLNGGQLSLDGPTFIASMGWDWIPGIRDRNIGIWQDVRIMTGRDVKIGDPHVITSLPNLPDTTLADIKILVPIKNLTKSSTGGNISIKFDGINISMSYTLNANEEKTLSFTSKDFKELIIKKPKLWWPNGYGAQHLYDLEIRVDAYDQFADLKKIRFGIRELSYELMVNSPEKGNHRIAYTPVKADNGEKPIFNYENVAVIGNPKLQETIPTLQSSVDESKVFEQLSNDDPVGQFLVFRVNGKRIFIKGGTSGMDEMMKRISREKLEPAFKLHKDANFNLIRNWTGENTEELFYELADEYGLLVWNDFWITTDDTVDPNNHALFVKNATDVVRRFRTHPSIAIWCPRNEGYAPEGLESQLNAMIAKEDPTRHYHGNSRHLNSINSGPYGYFKDQSLYYTERANGFNTEFGAQAIPTANTIRKFIGKEDLWPINDVWAYHDLHHTTHFFNDFIAAVNSYGQPNSMEDFARKAQMVTYDTWRAIIESWNSKMWNNTTGLILWMSHPAWPSMTWQTYTYDFETPGSYFGVKKAQEPLHVQMNLPDNKVIAINNTRIDQKDINITARYFYLNGKEYYNQNIRVDIPALQKVDCFIPQLITDNIPKYTLVRLEMKDKKGKIISINDYWKNWGDLNANQALNDLQQVNLDISIKKHEKPNNISIIEVSNPSNIIATAIKLNARNINTNEIILPAYFSDGYFNLLPGEKRSIRLELPANSPTFYISAEGYNITSDF